MKVREGRNLKERGVKGSEKGEQGNKVENYLENNIITFIKSGKIFKDV